VTLLVADEVALTVAAGGPVVALETSVIGQGLPHPRNTECAERMTGAIRRAGAVPAWIGLVDGAVIVGLDDTALSRFATEDGVTKVARRDVPFALAARELGATTVSATIWAAHRAGIEVGATGGTGGVHRGPHPDVSADLLELARTPVLLVCSGPKSIVDPALTAEKLEELGVSVVGYGTDRLPGFLASATAVPLEHRVDGPPAAAALALAREHAGIDAAILLCHPVPAASALPPEEVDAATDAAQAALEDAGIAGKAVTPFLLGAIAERTGGRSLAANLDLLEDNARVAAEVAVALSAARSG